ncbi:Transcriptional regulator [Umbelopsis sp. WA50703]
MEKDSRQFLKYQSPISVAPETANHYKHARQTSGQHTPKLSSIPGHDELISIKENLEKLLPPTVNRHRQFRKDAQFIEKWRNGREVSDKREERLPDPDKKSGSKKEDALNHADTGNSIKEESIGSASPLTKTKKTDSEKDTDSKEERNQDKSSASKNSTAAPRKTTSNENYLKKNDRRDKINGEFKSPSHKNSHQPPRNGQKTNQKPKNEPIEVDLIRVKSKDQIPIQTFWNAMEPYFKAFSESEREYLMEEEDNVKPYLTPPLGRHYLDTWAEEERMLVPSFEGSSRHSRSPSLPSRGFFEMNGHAEKRRYLESPDQLTEEYVSHHDLGCGNLTERLMSSLLQENIISADPLDGLGDTDNDASSVEENPHMVQDIVHTNGEYHIPEPSHEPPKRILNFEERLRRELRYAGLLIEDEIDWDTREDDEVCAEMRKLQKHLKEQVKFNASRKKKLLKLVESQLQYEQYKQILDGLDTQVEQSYLKRYQRTQKSKKKALALLPKQTLPDNALYTMEKRRTWVNSIGAIFQGRNIVMPTNSIYEEPTAISNSERENDTVMHT